MKQSALPNKTHFASLLLVLCGLFSVCIALTLAWSDSNQHKINRLEAGLTRAHYTVLLTKYETGKDGQNGRDRMLFHIALFFEGRDNPSHRKLKTGGQGQVFPFFLILIA